MSTRTNIHFMQSEDAIAANMTTKETTLKSLAADALLDERVWGKASWLKTLSRAAVEVFEGASARVVASKIDEDLVNTIAPLLDRVADRMREIADDS